jgi:hypothetical protein
LDWDTLKKFWLKGGAESSRSAYPPGNINGLPGVDQEVMSPLQEIFALMMTDANPFIGRANRRGGVGDCSLGTDKLRWLGGQELAAYPDLGWQDKWVVNSEDPDYEPSMMNSWSAFADALNSANAPTFLYFPIEWIVNLCRGMTRTTGNYIMRKLLAVLPNNMVEVASQIEYDYLPTVDLGDGVGMSPIKVVETLDGQPFGGILPFGARNANMVFVDKGDNVRVPLTEMPFTLSSGTLNDVTYINVATFVDMMTYYLLEGTSMAGKTEVKNGIIVREIDDFITRRFDIYPGYQFCPQNASVVVKHDSSGTDLTNASGWIHQRFMSADILAQCAGLANDDPEELQTQNKYIPTRPS